MIQTSYDPEADAFSVWFAPAGVVSAGTEEVAPGIMLDFNADGMVIGIEVLGVRQRTMAAGAEAVKPAAE